MYFVVLRKVHMELYHSFCENMIIVCCHSKPMFAEDSFSNYQVKAKQKDNLLMKPRLLPNNIRAYFQIEEFYNYQKDRCKILL